MRLPVAGEGAGLGGGVVDGAAPLVLDGVTGRAFHLGGVEMGEMVGCTWGAVGHGMTIRAESADLPTQMLGMSAGIGTVVLGRPLGRSQGVAQEAAHIGG